MWLLLSRRIRMWLLVAVGLPLAHRILGRVTAARAARHPDARSTAALQRVDSTLTRLTARLRRKG